MYHTPAADQCAMVKNMQKLFARIGDPSTWKPITEARYTKMAYERAENEETDEDRQAAAEIRQLRIDIGLKPDKPARRGRQGHISPPKATKIDI
jgi:hypothetical protein